MYTYEYTVYVYVYVLIYYVYALCMHVCVHMSRSGVGTGGIRNACKTVSVEPNQTNTLEQSRLLKTESKLMQDHVCRASHRETRESASRGITLRYVMLHDVTLRYITLHYITPCYSGPIVIIIARCT